MAKEVESALIPAYRGLLHVTTDGHLFGGMHLLQTRTNMLVPTYGVGGWVTTKDTGSWESAEAFQLSDTKPIVEAEDPPPCRQAPVECS